MAGMNDIWSALQNGVVAIERLTAQIALGFPPLTNPSTSAPTGAGTITFNSSLASGFVLITTSTGGQFRLALYPSS